jgi:hypothetical protein
MAGKLHKDYDRYTYVGGIAGVDLYPGRLSMAYAEGYVGRRKGLLQTNNPHAVQIQDGTAYNAWDQGWRDGNTGRPSTHVGGPIPT